jgi:hypothetical protein
MGVGDCGPAEIDEDRTTGWPGSLLLGSKGVVIRTLETMAMAALMKR